MSKKTLNNIMRLNHRLAAKDKMDAIHEKNRPKDYHYFIADSSYFGHLPQENMNRYVCDTYFVVESGKVVHAVCRTKVNGRVSHSTEKRMHWNVKAMLAEGYEVSKKEWREWLNAD